MSDVERVEPARHLRGSIRVPGDKSASHRALMISALAKGQSSITGLSPGDDVAATSVMIEHLGATRANEEGRVLITGPDEGLRPTDLELDCENSGTTMRLMSGVVATIPGVHQLVGDASLSKRPMDRVATPLGLMGAVVHGQGPTLTPPLTIESPAQLRSVNYRVPVASAQVKSAILLAGLVADGDTLVTEDVRTRATTEVMLRAAGIEVASVDVGEGRQITLRPGRPRRHDWFIPGDPSQAAFFAVLGAIHRDATLEVLSVDASPERVGFVSVLQRMGADVRLVERDAVTALHARSSTLAATEIHSYEIPSVDEVPVLAVAAAAASGVSAFRAMGELRHKESDRFASSLSLAQSLGCRVWSEGDDFFIEGLESASAFNDFTFASTLDHRLVMASAVAGCAGRGCTIEGASTVSSSYPHFFRDLALLQ
ncbi:MAG TPA: 3-phosphoshikimate 1-carboxyvinyltransferase [Acidimicrobiales bacterium]|jgi:3-phosphoshikimate 1-carboxyvinyltransferase|nr:3-phosphoshikimate 1-carboxyvinyltransferase [Acidimicrobiales bacterium]